MTVNRYNVIVKDNSKVSFFFQWMYKNGFLHCDGLSLEWLRQELKIKWGHQASPVFVYCATTLADNVHKYRDALAVLVC